MVEEIRQSIRVDDGECTIFVIELGSGGSAENAVESVLRSEASLIKTIDRSEREVVRVLPNSGSEKQAV